MPDIDLKKIQPNRLNPRLEFSKARLDELADSIKQVGIVEPIVVRPKGEGMYEVVVGERRYRAAHQAGLDRVPTIIHNYTDEQVMELNLIENIQRDDLSAVEKGHICKSLLEQFPERYPSQGILAKKLGQDPVAIASWLQTLGMPNEVQRLIAPETQRRTVPKGKIDYDTAVRIGRQIKEPKRFVEVIEHIAENRIPRRIATQVTKHVVREPEKPVGEIFRELVDEAPVYLPFSRVHADSILRRIKTQTSRKTKEPRLQKGMMVRAQVTYFADLEITDVYRKKLGDFDADDAKREGGYTLEEFKEVWTSLHDEWVSSQSVYVIRFRLAGLAGQFSTTLESE